MSLIVQGRLAAKRAAIFQGDVTPRGAGDASASLRQVPEASTGEIGALAQVVQFIPVEVIGIFVAVQGIICSVSGHALAPALATRASWGTFGICVVAVPYFLWLGGKPDRKSPWAPRPTARLVHLSWMGVVAFTTWVLALPKGPFSEHVATVIGTAAMTVVAAMLPPLARKLELV